MQHGPQSLQNRFFGDAVEMKLDSKALGDIWTDVDLLITEQRYPNHGHSTVNSFNRTHKSSMGQEHFNISVAWKTLENLWYN